MKLLSKSILFLGMMIIWISCDKIEGCMDKDALNYDITAEVSKGCIYCNSTPPEMLNTFNGYLVENRFGTELFQDSVLFITIEHKRQEFVYDQCGTSGCSFKITAKNISGFRMESFQFNFEVPLSTQFGTYFFQFNSNNGQFLNMDAGEERNITSYFFPQNPQSCQEMVDSGFTFASIFSGVYVP